MKIFTRFIYQLEKLGSMIYELDPAQLFYLMIDCIMLDRYDLV